MEKKNIIPNDRLRKILDSALGNKCQNSAQKPSVLNEKGWRHSLIPLIAKNASASPKMRFSEKPEYSNYKTEIEVDVTGFLYLLAMVVFDGYKTFLAEKILSAECGYMQTDDTYALFKSKHDEFRLLAVSDFRQLSTQDQTHFFNSALQINTAIFTLLAETLLDGLPGYQDETELPKEQNKQENAADELKKIAKGICRV